MEPTAVWIDCDPGWYLDVASNPIRTFSQMFPLRATGHDDMMALILAGHHPSLRVLGVSTSAGNQTLAKTTINALKVLHISGMQDVEVFPGSSKPIMRPELICPEIHGDSGLDGADFPTIPRMPSIQKKAITAMFDAFSSLPLGRKGVLICTGCMTNVALLLTVYPEVRDFIDRVCIMGGAIGLGNTSPAAEFNIQIDPEAAKIVFDFGIPVTMVPLECTHTALVTNRVLMRLDALNSHFGKLLRDLLLFFKESYEKTFGFSDPPLHDPCAVAWLIAPHIFKARLMRVDVETQSELTAGRTVCDVYAMSGKKKNVLVCESMDVESFWDLMLEAVERANAVSCLNRQ